MLRFSRLLAAAALLAFVPRAGLAEEPPPSPPAAPEAAPPDATGQAAPSAIEEHLAAFRAGLEAMRDSYAKTRPDEDIPPAQKTVHAVRAFEFGCFQHYFEPEKIKIWADTFFTPVSGYKAQGYMKYVNATPAAAWTSALKGYEMALVYQKSGACHLLIWDADPEAFHAEMKAMADRGKINIGPGVTYEYKANAGFSRFDLSYIKVSLATDGFEAAIYGSTPHGKKEGGEPDAIISIASSTAATPAAGAESPGRPPQPWELMPPRADEGAESGTGPAPPMEAPGEE